MTGRDLLENLSYVHDRFVEEAEETAAHVNGQEAWSGSARRLSVKKVLLVAATIGVMLTLVGCAVAYVMHMKDFQVGLQEETKPIYGENGWTIEGYAPVTKQVLTLSALEGSPGFRAAKEWYGFKQDYDPEETMKRTLLEEGTVPQFPAEYDAYNIYSQEMKDKLDEILKTYDLKPAGEKLEFRTEKNLYSALGVETFLETENGVTVAGDGGGCYANGNFWLNLGFTVPADEESQIRTCVGVLQWSRKDCFNEDLVTIEDTGDWEEWNYTMASGRTALILRSYTDSRGWILCDRGEGILAQMVEVRRDYGTDEGGNPRWEQRFMSNSQLQQIAEAIDKGVEPRLVSREDVNQQPQRTASATQDGYTVELKRIETDGWDAYITIGITAPEGTVISRDARRENAPLQIQPHNTDWLTSTSGEKRDCATSWSAQEDGDGRDNTQDFVLECLSMDLEGDAPFGVGSTWTLRIENLTNTRFDPETGDLFTETLAEGEWVFPITMESDSGDYRVTELLSEPMKLHASVGMKPDGTEVYEDVTVTSFRLRALGASMTGEKPMDFGTDDRFYAVMKDGSKTELIPTGGSAGPKCYWGFFQTRPALDLDQVDYVLLADGTEISMPE